MEDNAEVILHALAIHKVIGREQKVPAESAEPGKILWAVDGMSNGNDLMKAHHLNQQNLYHSDQSITHDLETGCANLLFFEKQGVQMWFDKSKKSWKMGSGPGSPFGLELRSATFFNHDPMKIPGTQPQPKRPYPPPPLPLKILSLENVVLFERVR